MNVTTEDLMAQIGEQAVEIRKLRQLAALQQQKLAMAKSEIENKDRALEAYRAELKKDGAEEVVAEVKQAGE